jgi:hypothetical protein
VEIMTAPELIARTRITSVWAALGGGEIRRNHSQAFWRNGDGFNVALNDDCGIWFDHRDNVGGGILDLIAHVRGGTRAEALKWLAERLGLPLDGARLSNEERRRYAQAQKRAPELARAATLWLIERRAELEQIKADALERMEAAREHGKDPMPAVMALERAASEHHLLSLMKNEGIVRAYLMARRDHPKHTRALVADGERWAQWSEIAVATLIAQFQDDVRDTDTAHWETDGGAARWLAPWPSDFTL